MKKLYFLLIIVSCILCNSVKANGVAQKMSGRILLQVEQNGEAWYVNPTDNKRIFLGRPADAFDIMKKFSLGISGETFEHFEKNIVTQRLAGRILINVDDFGRAYYVDPDSMEMLYLGRPEDAFNVMKNTGIGITDLDLNSIIVSNENIIAKVLQIEQAKKQPMKISDHCLSAMEIDLAERINEYRSSRNLEKIPVSKSLSYVAKVHLKDLVDNNPVTDKCNSHSWSGSGTWEKCCYPGETECIQNKARELINYPGDAVENIHWWDDKFHTPSPEGALDGWIKSEGHHIVIINEGWAEDFEWQALGVAIYKNYAAMWVGESLDPLGSPQECGSCDGFIDQEWEYNCYTDKAIESNDKKYCSYVNNSLEKEQCGVRTDIYACSNNYENDNLDCYKELVKKDATICDYLYKNEADILNCKNFSNGN